jgi:hypothetical protein
LRSSILGIHWSNTMAEPTDRPAPTAAPAYVAAPEPQRPSDPQLYRPLALAALVGFILALGWTIFLLLFVLVSVLRRTPLLFGFVVLLVPLVTLGISAIGWLQVQRSEGTKAGSNLALWGLLLSLLSGLSYGAYYGASSLAISQQAQPFALEWFDKLKNRQLEEAFRLTLPPNTRPRGEGAELRRDVELRFNTAPDGSGRGQFHSFAQGELVRFCWLAGSDAKVTPLGVSEWLYQEGGYRLRQIFQVDTPEGNFQVQVSTHGVDTPGGQGRQWRIVIEETRLLQPPLPTALGQRMIELRQSSTNFLRQWIQKLSESRLDEVYLETRPPAERAGARAAYLQRLDVAHLAAAFSPGSWGPDADAEGARGLYLPGYRAYSEGSLVQVNPEQYWAPEAVRAEVPAEVKKLFAMPPGALYSALLPEQVRILLWSRDAQHVRVYQEYQLAILPKYTATAALVIEGDARSVDDATVDPGWRVAALELTRGGSFSGPPGMPMSPRPPR